MRQTPRILRGIWSMMNGKQELEVSQELTNAYFGNPDAWQIHTNSENDNVEQENQES